MNHHRYVMYKLFPDTFHKWTRVIIILELLGFNTRKPLVEKSTLSSKYFDSVSYPWTLRETILRLTRNSHEQRHNNHVIAQLRKFYITWCPKFKKEQNSLSSSRSINIYTGLQNGWKFKIFSIRIRHFGLTGWSLPCFLAFLAFHHCHLTFPSFCTSFVTMPFCKISRDLKLAAVHLNVIFYHLSTFWI